MALDKQIYCYGVDTSYFYDEEEKYWHLRLLRLYSLRVKLKQKQKNNKEDVSWKLKSCNRVLKKNKERLSEILNSKSDTDLIRELNPSLVKDKNVVNLFESDLTRSLGIQTFTLTTEIFVIDVYFFQVFKNLVKNGFTYLGEKYVFLTASAGQIRQKKAVAIKESSFKQIEQKLMCGLTIDEINERGGMNQNKFLAYLALMNSATDVWEDFDIDKSIVVDDWETAVPGLVDHIDGVSYEIRREMTETVIPHMDGCGIMLNETTRMVRMPWVKGLLVTFPFDKFIKEKCGGEAIVTDIYGNEHKIIEEDIQYIFTKSQFKLWKFYDSWDCYKARFKNFGCNACYCNIEEPYILKSRINYQMLQTLSDMTDSEIDRIIFKTAQEIDDVGKDYQVTMRLLGATENNQYKSAMQEALLIYPELFKDSYNREILKQTKKSLVKQAKGGRLRVNGKYLFLAPDLYAFCEWLFLGEQNPQGLLTDSDVYTNQYRDGETLACLRSPHLYREWAIRTNRRSLELDYWFGETKCIYTSCHDLITRIVMADCDGDKLLVIKDRTLTNCAKRNMSDICTLAYDLKKAKGGLLNPDSMYNGMVNAYTKGNIGPVSNNITKIWNNGEITQEELDVVKWLCFENNAVIDCAKTQWLPERPKQINNTIKQYTKARVPNFFQYAKDKDPDTQVEPPNNSTMNRISAKIPTSRIRYNNKIGKFDWTMLINKSVDYTTRENSPIIEGYNWWIRNQRRFDYGDDPHINENDLYKYRRIAQDIVEYSNEPLDVVVNSLVAYLYTVKKSSNKKMLWACFGWTIVDNLRINTAQLNPICPICGKRFKPRDVCQHYCSEECYKKADNQRRTESREAPPVRTGDMLK